MTFDEQQAYNEGRTDATWMLQFDPDFGRCFPSREGMSDELKAALGCTLREVVELRKLTESMLDEHDDSSLPRDLGEHLTLQIELYERNKNAADPEEEERLSEEVWNGLEELATVCPRAALQAGAPLDDILPSEPSPEDRYYLQGMDDELKRHHESNS